MKPQVLIILSLLLSFGGQAKQNISAVYIPLADHYAAIVAHHKYKDKMQHANFELKQMKNWDLLQAYFLEEKSDMAFVMSPLAMHMYHKKPNFKWIGLMHRDGNALAINEELEKLIPIAKSRKDRAADEKTAKAILATHHKTNRPIEIALPHLQSTHAVVLYQYLKNHGLSMSILPNADTHVIGVSIAPPKAPLFLLRKSIRGKAAAFEQSLPWADVVETEGFGKVAWYSKQVLTSNVGHVECIAVANNTSIKNKQAAIKEVMFYIHKAGQDIEQARSDQQALAELVDIIHQYIPSHTAKAIIASLDPELKVINYNQLNIDKAGLNQIMQIAVEARILKQKIDIDKFADERFNIDSNRSSHAKFGEQL